VAIRRTERQKAVTLMERGMRLQPYSLPFMIDRMAILYFSVKRYEEALEIWKRILDLCEKGVYPASLKFRAHGGLAVVYAMLDRKDEAQIHLKEYYK